MHNINTLHHNCLTLPRNLDAPRHSSPRPNVENITYTHYKLFGWYTYMMHAVYI